MAGLLATLGSSLLGSLNFGSILKGAGRIIGAGAEQLGKELQGGDEEVPSQDESAREQKQMRNETRRDYAAKPKLPRQTGQPFPSARASYQTEIYNSRSKPMYDVPKRFKPPEYQKPIGIKHKDPVKQKQYEQVQQNFTKRQNLYGREHY